MELILENKIKYKAAILAVLFLITFYGLFNMPIYKTVTYKPVKEIYFNNYNNVDTIYPLGY